MNTPIPLYRSYDGYFTYCGPDAVIGRCYLQIYEGSGTIPLVLATEIAENPGPSITNAAGALATQVWRDLLPRARDGFRLFAVYRQRTPAGGVEERFAEVQLIAQGDQLDVLGYQPSSRVVVEALIGDLFSVPVPRS
jgi:hypothetical protein